MAQTEDDLLNITQSSGDGDMNAMAAHDGASSANQSSISVATDMSSPVLLLRTRTSHHANAHHANGDTHMLLTDDG